MGFNQCACVLLSVLTGSQAEMANEEEQTHPAISSYLPLLIQHSAALLCITTRYRRKRRSWTFFAVVILTATLPSPSSNVPLQNLSVIAASTMLLPRPRRALHRRLAFELVSASNSSNNNINNLSLTRLCSVSSCMVLAMRKKNHATQSWERRVGCRRMCLWTCWT